jgi:hypothetical protein
MEVYITAALSPDIGIRKPAEDHLFSLECTHEFIPNLLYLYKTTEHPYVRMPALMYAKSIITKNWVNMDE